MVKVNVPGDAEDEAETVSDELKPGVPDVGLKLLVTPGGIPDTLRETDCGLPDTKATEAA